jgi:hypothetical protein
MTPVMIAVQVAFWMVAAGAVYVWWLRPVLKTVPALHEIYLQTDDFWHSLRMRFAGIKGKLLIALNMGLMWFILAHDFILANTPGIDWSPLTAKVPGWAWPLIMLADWWLMKKFREYTDRRRDAGEAK